MNDPADHAHVPVLLDEVIATLDPRPGETCIDATCGRGGHAEAIARRIGPSGTLVLNDVDPANLAHAQARIQTLPDPPRVIPFAGNFAELPRCLEGQSLHANMLLADLGFASNQMDDPARGFSFMREGPLDMRLDPSLRTSAADLVNSLPESELVRLIGELGEEPAARAVARKIVQARTRAPIHTTSQLAAVVREAVGPRGKGDRGIDPATRTFQAFRIAVNDELGALEALLRAIEDPSRSRWLALGARVAFITFHSLEDRPVKRSLAKLVAGGAAFHVTPRPVEPSEGEVERNARSRSAKLRVVRLTTGSG